jgi:hypothetical protein
MVARRTHQFVTLKDTFGIALQERIHEFSALLTFIGIQSFSFRFLANDFLVVKGGRIIHRGYCICCCCCRLGCSTTTTMGDDGPPFRFWRLGVCLQGGAAVTAVGVSLVVVAPTGCRTKSRTERLEIQPCCSALLIVVLVLVFDFLECRSLLEEAGRLGVLLLQGVCVHGLAAVGISKSFFKGCSGGSLFVFGHVGCCIVVVSFCIVVLSL